MHIWSTNEQLRSDLDGRGRPHRKTFCEEGVAQNHSAVSQIL